MKTMEESPEKPKKEMVAANPDSEDESNDSESDSSDSGSDSSESSEDEVDVLLKTTYQLACERAVSLQNHYICHICGSVSTAQIAAALSNFSLSLYDLESLKPLTSFEGHTKPITNLRFHPNDPHQVITSSTDGTVRFWDTRESGRSTLTFKDDTAGSGQLKPFLSFDISKTGHFLCAGSELFDGDAFLVFGDARSGKVLGGYWESHSDDITQVAFHPSLSDCVATGSSDGLINIYDLKSETEDDALISSLNTESTVDKLAWYLLNGTHKGISCILDTMDVQLWNQDDASPLTTFSRSHVSKSTGWKADVSYAVNIHQTTSEDMMLLTGGSTKNGERSALLQVKGDDLVVQSSLPGNKQRVRCSWFNSENGSLITGGESGILSFWKPGEEILSINTSKILPKMNSPRSVPY